MTSPADEDSDDLDQLFAAAVDAAVQLLAANGEFYPFALALTVDGKLVAPQVDPGEDQPDAARVVDLLVAELRASRDGLRATAVCTDVRFASEPDQEQDAIRVELEPRTEQPVTVVVPYLTGPVLDDPIGLPAERQVFVPAP